MGDTVSQAQNIGGGALVVGAGDIPRLCVRLLNQQCPCCMNGIHVLAGLGIVDIEVERAEQLLIDIGGVLPLEVAKEMTLVVNRQGGLIVDIGLLGGRLRQRSGAGHGAQSEGDKDLAHSRLPWERRGRMLRHPAVLVTPRMRVWLDAH